MFFYLDRIRKKEYLQLLTGLVALLSIAILVIYPANGSICYAYPVMFSAPFLLGLCLITPSAGKEIV